MDFVELGMWGMNGGKVYLYIYTYLFKYLLISLSLLSSISHVSYLNLSDRFMILLAWCVKSILFHPFDPKTWFTGLFSLPRTSPVVYYQPEPFLFQFLCVALREFPFPTGYRSCRENLSVGLSLFKLQHRDRLVLLE